MPSIWKGDITRFRWRASNPFICLWFLLKDTMMSTRMAPKVTSFGRHREYIYWSKEQYKP